MTDPRSSAVVIAVNPMPRLYVRSLIAALAPTHDVRVLTFYRSSPLLSQETQRWCHEHGVTVRQFHYANRTTYVGRLVQASWVLRSWLSVAGVDVFHCQPNHLLTNYPTFVGREKHRLRLHLIPDGLANFYLTDVAQYEATMRTKRTVGRIVGLPFQSYGGNYLALGTAKYEDYWYLGSPGIMGAHLPLRRFDLVDDDGGLDATGRIAKWLFVGQPPSARADFQREYLRSLAAALKLSGGSLAYKPHPAERMGGQLQHWLSAHGIPIADIGNEPIETYARSFTGVVGVASSVLFNLRMLDWSNSVYSVLDSDRLAILTGRSKREMEQVISAAKGLEIHPLL